MLPAAGSGGFFLVIHHCRDIRLRIVSSFFLPQGHRKLVCGKLAHKRRGHQRRVENVIPESLFRHRYALHGRRLLQGVRDMRRALAVRVRRPHAFNFHMGVFYHFKA